MKKNLYYGYIIVLVLFIFQIVMTIPRTTFGVFIKPLIAEFNWPTALIAGIYSISSLVQGFSGIMMGWLNDRFGPRIVLTICGILIGSGLILVRFIDSAWQLYLLYAVLIGTGMGGLFGPQMSTIARWFDKRRNLMTGLLMTGRGVGGFIGPIVMTWLVYSHGWREALQLFGIVLSIIVIIGSQLLRQNPSNVEQVSDDEKRQITGKPSSHLTGLTLKEALRTSKFWLLSVIIFCVGFCLTTPTVHIVPFAIDRGISPAVAAFILSIFIGTSTVATVVVGMISDKIGNRRAFIFCISLIISIIFLLLPITSPWILCVILMILAFGGSGVAVIESGLTAELFGMKAHGAILGCIIFNWLFGAASGSFLGGLIYDFTGSYQSVFLLCGILVVAALILSVFLNHIKNKEAMAEPTY